MKWRTRERIYSGAFYGWAVGLAVFAVGGLLLDSWAVMGIGGAVFTVAIIVMGVLL